MRAVLPMLRYIEITFFCFYENTGPNSVFPDTEVWHPHATMSSSLRCPNFTTSETRINGEKNKQLS